MKHSPWRILGGGLLAVVASLSAQTVSPNTTLSNDALASRFLAQATFGPTTQSIADLRNLGYDYNKWIDAQIALPPSAAAPLVRAGVSAGTVANTATGYKAANRRARNQVMIGGADQLRQRVAYALSQILVISDVDTGVLNGQEGSSDYYDLLVRDAFTTYRQILGDVTRHPMMGRYLTYFQNQKANTATGTRPDENYARESMQLFSVGLYLLNADGTYQTDAGGRAIEAYTNANITEHARVYTGFTNEDNNPNAVGTGADRTGFPRATANYTAPMKMWEPQHDVAAKSLLHYSTARKPDLPAGQAGLVDVSDLLDNLVEHPSTAPFVSRLLIQRLVTSNPSNAYVGRVAAVFGNNGQGKRGDMVAVIKAILLDPEARQVSYLTDPEHGKLQEPFLRVTQVLRAFNYSVPATDLPYDFGSAVTENNLGQFPLASPTVFNFYLPDYQPPGVIEGAGLTAPEFQIQNSVFAISVPNVMLALANGTAGSFSLDYSAQAALGGTPSALLDNVDLLLTHGTMSANTRTQILAALNGVTTSMVPAGSTLGLTRARLAVYLTAVSPDFAILK